MYITLKTKIFFDILKKLGFRHIYLINDIYNYFNLHSDARSFGIKVEIGVEKFCTYCTGCTSLMLSERFMICEDCVRLYVCTFGF